MATDSLSIKAWQARYAEQPDGGAAFWQGLIERVDPDAGRAMLAWSPSQDELGAAFAACRPGPLQGVPIVVKDLYDIAGLPTTASSTFLSAVRPIPDATAPFVQRWQELGAVVVGKTHLNEFAYGLSGQNPHYGDVRHPILPERLAGGSSSGSARAVATGLAPIGLGTDTGGSIRVPAAFCGLYGLRLAPTDVSAEGCVPLAPTFDSAGWMSRSAIDLAQVTAAFFGWEADVDSEPLRVLDLTSAVADVIEPEVLTGCRQKLAELGAVQDRAVAAGWTEAMAGSAKTFSVLQSREALDVHTDWLDDFRDAYDPTVWKLIERARHWTVSEVDAARSHRQRIGLVFEDLFRQWEVLALPAVPSPAVTAPELTPAFRERLLALTTPGSLDGRPVVTVPVTLGGGLSAGVQLILARSGDRVLRTLLHRLTAREESA